MDVYAVLSSIISGISVAAILALTRYLRAQLNIMHADFYALKESQRNQLKSSIVRTYEEADKQGFILATELETMNRRYDSYKQLNGNSYIGALMDRANHQIEVHGELPPHEHHEGIA